MPLFVKFKNFLRNLFSSRHVDGDLDAEVRSRLAMLADENIRADMLPREAQRRAPIELGGIDQVKEQVSEIRIGHWLHSVLADCRYGARVLRKSPGCTAVAVLPWSRCATFYLTAAIVVPSEASALASVFQPLQTHLRAKLTCNLLCFNHLQAQRLSPQIRVEPFRRKESPQGLPAPQELGLFT
jgi:hypothetical protein